MMGKMSAKIEQELQNFRKSVNGSVFSWRMDEIFSNFELELENLIKSVKFLIEVRTMK
jgi:hypothetical protein